MLEEFIESFLQHLNQQHERINFTIEYEQDRKLPYLDTCVKVENDGTLTTNVYCKKTHTNQYLNFNYNHHLRQKVGIISTLMKRTELISNEEDKIKEIETVQEAFRTCDYPEWTLKKKRKKAKAKTVKED